MKLRLALCCAVSALLLASAVPARTADLPAKIYTKAPPVVVVPSWAGTYVGVSGGYGWGRSDQTDPGLPAPGGGDEGGAGDGSYGLRGGVIGLTLGRNWQTGRWVYGLEADYSWSDIKGSSDQCGASVGNPHGCGSNIASFGTFRGRVGYTLGATGNWLLFATGGLAAGDVSGWDALTNASGRTTLWGWTAGGGVETIVAPNWTVKAEYLHIDLGKTHLFDIVQGGPETVTFNTNLVRLGVNYKFAPVGAPDAAPSQPAPVANWSGLYVGGHGGSATSRSEWAFQQEDWWIGDLGLQPDGWRNGALPMGRTSKAFGGVQIGFNTQFDRIVLGAEWSWSDIRNSRTVPSPFYPGVDTETTKLNGLHTITGRLGFAWDRVLVYGKGGWAQGRVELSARTTGTIGDTAWNPAAVDRSGSMLGAGIEYMITPNIIAGVEYNRVDLGKGSYGAFNTGFFTDLTRVDDRTAIETITGRLSFKFDPPTPFSR